MYRTVVTICTAPWSLYVPHSGHCMYHQFNIHTFYFLPTQCRYGSITFCKRPIAKRSAINPSKYSNFGITTTAISTFRNAVRQNKSHLTRRISIPSATRRRGQSVRSGRGRECNKPPLTERWAILQMTSYNLSCIAGQCLYRALWSEAFSAVGSIRLHALLSEKG